MGPNNRNPVLMRARFSDGSLAKRTLEEIGRDPELSVNIFRGRMTQEDASFELEVAGPAPKIKEVFRLSHEGGLRRRFFQGDAHH